jgi:hypothetical protein
VRALPALQALVDKYRNDPDVAIVSIDTWDPPQQLKHWLEKNPQDMRILLDDGYAQNIHLSTFPTTWFLDRAGVLRYRLTGGSPENLVEEHSWLIEELKKR